MIGKITGISGPTVTVRLSGLKLHDQVSIGRRRLRGEVIRLERGSAVVQVYENTLGLGAGEPAEGLSMPLTVRLGPGLLATIFDGLQRPLVELQKHGPFILPAESPPPLDCSRRWNFIPSRREGETVSPGESIGYVEEGQFRHFIPVTGQGGRITEIRPGPFTLREPLAILQNGQEIYGCHDWPVRVPRPYKKKMPPTQPLVTGQRVIDFLFPLARGGTAIFPGGFGTGKTVVEHAITKFVDAEIVIYVGCGERGNEMAEMLEEFRVLVDPWTQKPLSSRTIMVVNTSNMPVAAREASIYTAATMAEYYRDMGYNVIFLADSISRWAEALREISSALEEMPGEEGYPTYLSSRLAAFIARAGVVETLDGRMGSLSMILAVSPPGGDFTEPVTQACLRNTGAFLMLDTRLAHRRHFPAINWGQSYSLYEEIADRGFAESVSPEWKTLRSECRNILKSEEKLREVAEIVGAEGLQENDRRLMKVAERIRREFLCQNAFTDDAFSAPSATFEKIRAIVDGYHKE